MLRHRSRLARAGFTVMALAGLMLAMPLLAHANAAAKNSNQVSTTLDLFNPASLAGKALQPGTYVVTADDAKVSLSRSGKVVAEAAAQWKDTANKSKYSAFVTDDGKIKEIRFAGKTRYLEIVD